MFACLLDWVNREREGGWNCDISVEGKGKFLVLYW